VEDGLQKVDRVNECIALISPIEILQRQVTVNTNHLRGVITKITVCSASHVTNSEMVMDRRDTFSMLTGLLFALSSKADASPLLEESTHIEWVAQVLRRMKAVRPGMTRRALLETFETEGGLSTELGV
jgi:hypothetical protein